jgi:hypothetical protein
MRWIKITDDPKSFPPEKQFDIVAEHIEPPMPKHINKLDDSLYWVEWMEQDSSHGLNEEYLADAVRDIYAKINELIDVVNKKAVDDAVKGDV